MISRFVARWGLIVNQLSSFQALWNLINVHTVARCVHIIAEFGVADALDKDPRSVAELAAAVGMNSDALARMLRLLAANDVFAREGDRYVHTPASVLLRSDHSQSLRPFARMIGMPAVWQGFTDLKHTAKIGTPAVDWADMVSYFSDHPDEANLFNQAMVSKSSGAISALVETYNFNDFDKIADIGGGRGHLLQAILNRTSASGILFDLSHVIGDASGIDSQRIQLVGGDFFRDRLPVADAYILMDILHDWADDRAADILTGIRRSAPSHARILVVETLVSESPGPHFGKTLDILMLAVTGGRERTRSEYDAMFESTGFRLKQVIPTDSQYSIIEAAVA